MMKSIKGLTLLIALNVLPASAAEKAIKPDALRLARAQLDQKAYSSLFHAIMERQIAACSSGDNGISSDVSDRGHKYVDSLSNHLPDVQNAVAAGYEKYIPAHFIGLIANFFESSAGRHMIANGSQAMIGPMTSQIQLCGDRPGTVAPDGMNAVRQALSPADMASIRAFANAPTGQAFIAASKQVAPIMAAAFRKAAQDATLEASQQNGH